MRVVTAALRLRRDRPDTFPSGGYTPVLAEGDGAEHVVAFLRGDNVLVAVSRYTVRLAETGWGDTSLTLPDGRVDRPHHRRPVQRPGSLSAELVRRSCRWRCWSDR